MLALFKIGCTGLLLSLLICITALVNLGIGADNVYLIDSILAFSVMCTLGLSMVSFAISGLIFVWKEL